MSNEEDSSTTYNELVKMWNRLAKEEPEPYRYFVNRVTLHRMMISAPSDTRAALEKMKDRKILIVLDYLPEGKVYRLDATIVPKELL